MSGPTEEQPTERSSDLAPDPAHGLAQEQATEQKLPQAEPAAGPAAGPQADLQSSPWEDGDGGGETDGAGNADGAVETARLRERLLDRFTAWVDRMLIEEPPPEGVPIEMLADALEAAAGRQGPPDPSADLYAIYSAMTGLTGEVRLQGRAFKQLADALAPLSDLASRLEHLEAAQVAAADELGEVVNLARSQAAQASQGGSALPKTDEVLTVLFDLYDRLGRAERTLEAMDDAPPDQSPPPPARPAGWFDRLLGRSPPEPQGEEGFEEVVGDARDEALAAVREGYRLTLARLAGAFHQWGIERIGARGRCSTLPVWRSSRCNPGTGPPTGPSWKSTAAVMPFTAEC